jgi:3-oxoacyl-[acyl-carrier-protein] synthase I
MSRPMPMHVIGAGAVTSVGNSLPATAAAVRAGLDNFRETDFKDCHGEPVIGAAMRLDGDSTDRVGGAAKLGKALAWAVEEAIASAGVASPLPETVPLFFLGDQTRPAPLVEAAHLCHSACATMFSIPERLHLQAFTGGEVGCVDALLSAREALAKGAPYVVIAAADTWLRVPDIAHATEHRRLLDAESSCGFIPAEGAAAILIASRGDASALTIDGLGLAEEAASLLGDEPCTGIGLAAAVRAALGEAGCQAHDIHLRASNAAGESYFAEELAYAWARLLRKPRPGRHLQLFPAASVGHVGCVFGPLMLALTWQLSRRRRLPGPRVLIELSSSTHLRGAIAAHAGVA